MGDRGQVKILQWDEEQAVYLYTHWGASELKDLVKQVLARRLRWDDNGYLARMIFSQMVKDDLDGELGYGITTNQAGDAWITIEVDCENNQITVTEYDETTFTGTFEEFISS